MKENEEQQEEGKLKLVGSCRSSPLPISDLPVSVQASPSHLELEAREEGHERYGQIQTDH